MSEDPLIKKLNLKGFSSKLVLYPPSNFILPEEFGFDKKQALPSYDLVLAFVLTKEEMVQKGNEIMNSGLISEGGYLYLAYPKKENKEYSTFVHRDEIFPAFGVNEEDGYIQNTDFKFNKMVSLNDVFTIVGLKRISALSRTKEKTAKSKPSQRVEDYVENIPGLVSYLQKNQKALIFFQGLTYGYQKGWARYVYSSKVEATQNKRLKEMEAILLEGFKSKELYLKDKNK